MTSGCVVLSAWSCGEGEGVVWREEGEEGKRGEV